MACVGFRLFLLLLLVVVVAVVVLLVVVVVGVVGAAGAACPGGRRCAVPSTPLKRFEIFDMKFYDALWCCFFVVCYLAPCL